MSQKKHLAYAQAKGAPAGFHIGLLAAPSISRSVYASVLNNAAQDHYLHADAGMVRIQALTNGVYVAFSAGANKAPAKASGTLTSDETDVADETEVVVGAKTYRIIDTPEQENDVKRDGTDADATLASLAHAINGTGTPGTDYFAGTTPNADVISSGVVGHALTLTAKRTGAAGNSLALSSSDAHVTAGAFSSGADGNFDDYVPAGQSKEITLDESVEVLSLIGDGGTAAVSVVEY